jgi:cell division protein FtsL
VVRRRRRVSFLIVSVLLIGMLVLSVATLQALISQNSFRIRELSRREAALQESVGQLSLEVARLSSPGRIAKRARRGGLRLPDEVHTLPVRGDRRTGPSAPGPGLAIEPLPQESP